MPNQTLSRRVKHCQPCLTLCLPLAGALLQFGRLYGMDFAVQRKEAKIVKSIPFSSSLKRMSTVIDQPFPKSDLPYTFHTKGAAEIVLDMCSHVVLPTGEVTVMTAEHKAHFTDLLTSLSDQALRAICLAAKPVSDPEVDVTESESPDMICLGMVGIQDPLRPGIADAVTACENAGVTVRMVTGDSLAIAKSIAKECGIYKVQGGPGQGRGGAGRGRTGQGRTGQDRVAHGLGNNMKYHLPLASAH